MKIEIGILLVTIMIMIFSGCSIEAENTAEPVNTTMIPGKNSEMELEEGNSMKREFCTVERIQTDCFVLKNTSGELYSVDISYLGDLKEGDLVLLIYTDRKDKGDGTYEADISSVYPSENTLEMPSL